MEDSLDELVEKTETGYNLVVTQENKQTSENPDAAYDVRYAFDEEHNEWLYVIFMPEKDKMVLEEICKGYKIKVEDLMRQFYLWVMREPEAAAQWLKDETERKKV